MFTIGVSDLHETTNVMRIHENGNCKTQTLASQAGDQNRHSGRHWLFLCNDRCDGTSKHNGEDGQEPRRHETVELVGVAAEEERVLEGGQAEGDEGVRPECDCHCGNSPRAVGMIDVVGLDDVFLGSGDNGCDGQEEGAEEETFTFVRNGGLEGARVLGEAENHGHGDTGEQEKVEDVEDGTNGLDAGERMRLDGDKRTKTTSSHGKSVVGPCVVRQPLTGSEVRLVWVLLSRNLGVLVPFSVTMSIAVLELLEVNGIHLRRGFRSWIPKGVFCRSVQLFYVNRVAISVHLGGKVCIVGCIKGCGCLDPCVRATCLARRKETLVLGRGKRGRR